MNFLFCIQRLLMHILFVISIKMACFLAGVQTVVKSATIYYRNTSMAAFYMLGVREGMNCDFTVW